MEIGLMIMVFVSFIVSSVVGFGGSLILVPILVLAVGVKEGVALAALLLALNNGFKLVAYRRTIPWRHTFGLILIMVLATAVGAGLMVRAPEGWVAAAVVGSIALHLAIDGLNVQLPRIGAHVPGMASGLVSGFSGTAGPLKGLALRMLRVDRFHMVGAAAIVSIAGDISKTMVFASGGLLRGYGLVVIASLPLMPVAAWAGKWINERVDEAAFTRAYWLVMVGYAARLLLA